MFTPKFISGQGVYVSETWGGWVKGKFHWGYQCNVLTFYSPSGGVASTCMVSGDSKHTCTWFFSGGQYCDRVYFSQEIIVFLAPSWYGYDRHTYTRKGHANNISRQLTLFFTRAKYGYSSST